MTSRASTPRLPEGVRLALYQGWFASCAEEMGTTLMRTAHSPNIKERLDHSCALFDASARLVAQAAHIPVHLGSLSAAVEAACAAGPLGRGDVVLLNDPYAGGTHLPDLTLVSPVFLGGPRRTPDFLLASRAHHADIGGAAPGSMPLAREIYEEGLRIPPVRLVRSGAIQEDLLRLLLANVRTPEERYADLRAQLGAHATGERRLLELVERVSPGESARGARTMRAAAGALIAHARRRVSAELARLPRGVFRFADALDDDGRSDQAVPIRVALHLGGRRVVADFAGSSPQVDGPVNAVASVTRAAVCYVVQCVLGGDGPVNHGSFAPVEVRAPVGSVVNPRPPAAVSAGNVETSQRIVDVVLGAFARALPDRIPAASYGTMSNLLIGGVDPRDGLAFAYYETLGGGHGAGPGWDGASAMQAHMTNTRNTPIEALEHAIPVRVRATRIRSGSGGAGRTRGGEGIVRAIELLAPARVTVISDRRRLPPYGLRGGRPGARGVNRVQSDATRGASRALPGKFQIDLEANAVLTVASPGGGGYGRPVGRAPRRRRRVSPAGR
jgi:N-methylhydantoinase B